MSQEVFSLMVMAIVDEFNTARRTHDPDARRTELLGALYTGIHVAVFEARKAGISWRDIADALIADEGDVVHEFGGFDFP